MTITSQQALAMNDEQFRLFMIAQLNAHQRQSSEMKKLIEENTLMTKSSNEKLVSVFAILNFSETSASRIVKFGRFISATAKVLIPIVMLYSLIVGLSHGHFPTFKDLL